MSIVVRRPHYIKNAYSHSGSFRHYARFLKTTAWLSNLIPPCFYYLTNLVSVSYTPVFLIRPLEIRPHMVGIKASLLCCFFHSDGIPQAQESRLCFCSVGNKEGYHISHLQMMWCNPAAAGCWASRKVTPIPSIGICVVLIYIRQITRPHKKHT